MVPVSVKIKVSSAHKVHAVSVLVSVFDQGEVNL